MLSILLSFRHPFISKEERDLIEVSLGKQPILPSLNRTMSTSDSIISELDGSEIGHDDEEPIITISNDQSKSPAIPFKAIFTSIPFWAIMVAHSCQNWGFYTLLAELPTYMSRILHFDIKEVRNQSRVSGVNGIRKMFCIGAAEVL